MKEDEPFPTKKGGPFLTKEEALSHKGGGPLPLEKWPLPMERGPLPKEGRPFPIKGTPSPLKLEASSPQEGGGPSP